MGFISKILFGFHDRFHEKLKGTWIVPDEEELTKLRDKTFAIAGLGGVGTITAELLARWGIKRFRLLDMDRYSESNMARQLFAVPETVGRFKAEVAAERIREINPSADVEMVLSERVTKENADRFLDGVDLLIQTADTPSALILYSTAEKKKVPLVNGYCKNRQCFVQVFDYRNSSCRSLVESLKEFIKWRGRKQVSEMSTDELDSLDGTQYSYEQVCPPLNFVTNTAGCLMVGEGIKLLLGRGKIAHYPNRINLDLVRLKMKVDNPFSLFKPGNYLRLFTMLKGRAHLKKLQKPENAEVKEKALSRPKISEAP